MSKYLSFFAAMALPAIANAHPGHAHVGPEYGHDILTYAVAGIVAVVAVALWRTQNPSRKTPVVIPAPERARSHRE